MGELRNRFKRPAFNGFLTRWNGSGGGGGLEGTPLEWRMVFVQACCPTV